MLTQEQINNLKPGDPVFVRGKFKYVDDDGDFWIETNNCYRCYDPLSVFLPSEHGTSVPPPKHDPCRPFKAGDVARVVERFGRTDATHTHWDVADKYMKTVVTYNKAFHPNAKAAAEAECARLNAEWRKEQNND